MTSAAFIASRLDSCGLTRPDRLMFVCWVLGRQTLVDSTKDLADAELEWLEAWLRRSSNEDVLEQVRIWKLDVQAEQISIDDLLASSVPVATVLNALDNHPLADPELVLAFVEDSTRGVA